MFNEVLLRRGRLQNEPYARTVRAYNNRRGDKPQHLSIDTSYLDITYIPQLEKVHIF